MNESGTQKKGLGALDWMILILAVFVIGSVVLRHLRTSDADSLGKIPLEQYLIGFEVKNIREESAKKYMNKGDRFYLADTGVPFGVLTEQKSIGGASKYYELLDGRVILGTMEEEVTKELYRVDVKSEVVAEGRYDAEGTFLLGGTRRIGLNKELTIYSKNVTFTVLVTDIRKVGVKAEVSELSDAGQSGNGEPADQTP